MTYDPQSQGMGVGVVGVGDPEVVFKRKNRWTIEVTGKGFTVPAYFAKMAGRPNFSVEETQIDFLNDKMFIPGKVTWEPITVTYMDVGGTLSGDAQGGNMGLYTWLASVFDFTRPDKKFMNSKRSCYGAKIVIKLWDGCGNALETWTLSDAWPQTINFGELDMSSSDTVDIELTIRYSQVSFKNECGPQFTSPECCGCTGGGGSDFDINNA